MKYHKLPKSLSEQMDFRFFVIQSTVTKDLKLIGRLFQSFGAADWKAQSPRVLKCVQGTLKNP